MTGPWGDEGRSPWATISNECDCDECYPLPNAARGHEEPDPLDERPRPCYCRWCVDEGVDHLDALRDTERD